TTTPTKKAYHKDGDTNDKNFTTKKDYTPTKKAHHKDVERKKKKQQVNLIKKNQTKKLKAYTRS
ncbi:32933_t:CDS:2, partial [Racocetra persica]